VRGGEDFEEAVVAAVSRSRCLRLGGRRGRAARGLAKPRPAGPTGHGGAGAAARDEGARQKYSG